MPRLASACRSITAAAIFATALPLSQALAGDFVWQNRTYNDPSNKGRYTARLSYQVPETDDVQFQATCVAGSSGRFATTVIGYDTGRRGEGTEVVLLVSTDDYRGRLAGTVYGTRLEHGVSGVLLHPDFDDPFWQALASGSSLSYRLTRGRSASIGLSGSGSAVRKFIGDCKAIHAASNPAPAPRPRASAGPSCKQFGKIRSRESRTPVTVTFLNRTGSYRGVMWINFQGRPVEYANLNAGQTYTVQTYLTHPWMFTDGPGNCIEMFLPRAGVTRFEINAASPAFGPGND